MNRPIKNSFLISFQAWERYPHPSESGDLKGRDPKSSLGCVFSWIAAPPMAARNDIGRTENGSVIFWILIAVGLMAALSYAFMGSSRNSTSIITDTQAEAYASEIIAYGNEVKQAVKRLQLRGCSDTEISFENNVVSGYTNPNSPNDKSCHVFDIAGGGLSWTTFPNIQFDYNFGYPAFGTGDNGAAHSVREFGIDENHDLFLVIAHRTDLKNYNNALKVCKYINSTFNIPEYPANFENLPSFYHGAFNTKFIGSYNDNNGVVSQGQELHNSTMWCSTHTPTYIYITKPLIIR